MQSIYFNRSFCFSDLASEHKFDNLHFDRPPPQSLGYRGLGFRGLGFRDTPEWLFGYRV